MEKVVNILLVEDDTVDVMDARRTLDKLGILYKMQVAKNGEEAIEMLNTTEMQSEQRFDIVLLDLNMPKMNGIEFLTAIRADNRWKDLKIFIITTSGEREDKQESEKLGVSGFIVKPMKFNNPSSIDSFNLMIDLMNFKKENTKP